MHSDFGLTALKVLLWTGLASFGLYQVNSNNLTDLLHQVFFTKHCSKLSSSVSFAHSNNSEEIKIEEAYGKLPLYFEPNSLTDSSLAPPEVKFMSRGNGYNFYLTPAEVVFVLQQAKIGKKIKSLKFQTKDLLEKMEVFHLRLINSNYKAICKGVEQTEGTSNYFIGNDPKKWRTNISQYAKVKLQDVYPGIDMVYYGSQGKLEYDFVVQPGTDFKAIRLRYEGSGKASIDSEGNLVLGNENGAVIFKAPVVYQEANNKRRFAHGKYLLTKGNQVGFEIEGYDPTLPLVIDPVLDYSTYLGGSGTDAAYGIAVDTAGNAYVTGNTTSANFPTTAGVYQTVYGGGLQNAFVTKLNPTGTALIYSTYLGGSGGEYYPHIVIDSSGNAYVTGKTQSLNFPTTAGAYQTTLGNISGNAFVTKLNPTGTGLVYSTYLGGSGYSWGDNLTIDSSGNAYVTGFTYPGFPTTGGAYQTGPGGSGNNVFMTKLNTTGTGLVYSTYFGGNGGDVGLGITLDSLGKVYLTGQTTSTNFPTTAGAFSTTFGGVIDAFVAKLNPAGGGASDLVYSTYLGGNGEDTGYGIAVDLSGNAYVTGVTGSTNFPTTAGAYQTTHSGTNDVFVTEVNSTGSALIYSTYLGGSSDSYGYGGIALDSLGYVYVTGFTGSANFPTTGGAYQTVFSGSTYDVFVVQLKLAGGGISDLVYSTFLGGSSLNRGEGIALGPSGDIYVTGYTTSANFPTTAGVYQTVLNGSQNAFVTRFGVGVNTPTNTITATSTPIVTQTITNTPTSTNTSGPTISIQKKASQNTAQTGDTINYDVLISVSGSTATGVLVQDTLPAGVTFNGFETPTPAVAVNSTQVGSVLNWSFVSLPVGTYQLPYQVSVNSFVSGNTPLFNQAWVSFGGGVPVTASCQVALTGLYTVSINIYNSSGEVVKTIPIQKYSQPINNVTLQSSNVITTLQGPGSSIQIYYSGNLIGTWDGSNNIGNPVTNGTYTIQVASVSTQGVVTSVTQQAIVNRALLNVTVNIYNSAGELVRDLYTLIDDSVGTQMTNASLSSNVISPGGVANGSTTNLQIFVITTGTPVTLTWDGTNNSGMVVTPGTYSIQLHWDNGQSEITNITRSVLVTVGGTRGVVIARPNVLTSKQSLTTTFDGTGIANASTVIVNIYTISGELVKSITGVPGAATASWNASGMASGIYIATVEVQDANDGILERQSLKILVLH